jgi:hypothetical protein
MREKAKARRQRLERALDKADLVDLRIEEIKFRYERYQDVPKQIVQAFEHVRARRLKLALAILEDNNEWDAAEALAAWIPVRQRLSTQDWTDINEIHLSKIGATK